MRDYPQSFDASDLGGLGVFLGGASAVLPLREAAALPIASPSVVALRHDVDHDLDHAVRFAEWEAAQGYRSSYYVLPNSWYAADVGFAARLRYLEELGHEVGLHSNVVGLAYAESGDAFEAVDGSALPTGFLSRAAEIMREQIAFLRSLGLDVSGTAAHGNGIEGASNLQLWAIGYSPQDFGLDYEAYHLHRDVLYLSDNRGRWSDPLRLDETRQTHVLTHPEHWRL